MFRSHYPEDVQACYRRKMFQEAFYEVMDYECFFPTNVIRLINVTPLKNMKRVISNNSAGTTKDCEITMLHNLRALESSLKIKVCQS